MLRGLTDRPNVQSTLILSKKDGSIIRATGSITTDKQLSSGAGGQYQWSKTQDSESDAARNKESDQGNTGQDEGGAQQDTQQPVELLAASIFQFVNQAASLGVTLGSISRDADLSAAASYRDSSASRQEQENAEEESLRTKEDEIQLLRLRIKFQEIIVFPDPNYICCVVQRVGKAGSNQDRR